MERSRAEEETDAQAEASSPSHTLPFPSFFFVTPFSETFYSDTFRLKVRQQTKLEHAEKRCMYEGGGGGSI